MKRKFKVMAILTLIVGLNLFLSPAFNVRVYAQDDETVPTLETVTIDKNYMSKNGSLSITIKGYDFGSGIAGGIIGLKDKNDDSIYGELEQVNKETLRYTFKPSVFDFVSDEYVIDKIELYDQAQNTGYFYAPEDYDFTSFSISGYGNIGEISGANRYDTAIEISKHFEDVNTVIIALGTNFPDALSAGPLSYALNAPVLLASNKGISANVSTEIRRLGAKSAIILGGSNAISDDIYGQLRNVGIDNIERISGKDRYSTAVKVGDYLFNIQKFAGNMSNYAVIASGNSFPDALAVSSMASLTGRPILLTQSANLDVSTKEFLKNQRIGSVFVIGGASVVNDGVISEIRSMGIEVRRYAGKDRYETSAVIAENFFPESGIGFVSNGLNFADALAAAPLAAMKSAPILLTNNKILPKNIEKYLQNKTRNKIQHVTVIGGNSAVSDHAKRTMSGALQNK